MAQSGDILKFVLTSQLGTRTAQNVFYFALGATGSNAMFLEDIANGWITIFNAQLLTNLSNQLFITSILAENATDDLEFYENTFSFNGDVTGDVLPPQATLAFKLIRSTKVTRNGSKRYMGVPELAQNLGILNYVQSVRDVMQDFHSDVHQYANPNDGTQDIILSPVIVGRTLNGSGVYEVDLTKINPLNSCKLDDYVGSQDTRRY